MENPELEKEELVAAYLAAAQADSATCSELPKLTVALDGLYWKLVENILQKDIDVENNTLHFSEDDRLLLDFGLLDERLVKGAPANLRQELLNESQLVGAPNHFYLSEWLSDRFNRYQLETEVKAPQSADDQTHTRQSDAYHELFTYFARQNNGEGVKLPGVSATAMSAMLGGRLDKQIIKMGINVLQNRNRRDFLNRSRLAGLRRDIIARARSIVGDIDQLKIFDNVDDAYRQEWEKSYRETLLASSQNLSETQQIALAQSEIDVDREKAFHWLLSELHFVRTLLPLGALAGGIFRSCAVMLEYRPRVTRAHTARILERVSWCDRNYQLAPVVLIAPFTGRGIYEWDRDSLIISLIPVNNPEDSAANAVANFSMMIDSFQHNGLLKNTYRMMFPKANFQKEFQADYRTWLCKVGYGQLGALSAEKLDFFASQVAPDFAASPALALAPRELRTLSFTAREVIRKQIQRQVSTAKDSWMTRWRLGILYWLDRFTSEAMRELMNAANLAPKELQTYFAVACLLRECDRIDKAKQLFTICQSRGKCSIWNFYATRALSKM